MSEQNGTPTLDQLLGDGSFDLGSNAPDYDPFAQAEELLTKDEPNITPFPTDAGDDDVENPQEPCDASDDKGYEKGENQPETSTSVIMSHVMTPDFNPLADAVNKAEEQNVKAGAAGLLARPPVFTYGSAKEDITDKTSTFEQLRIAKSEDFPELDDVKRVTWTMEYGTITKQVPKPKETLIYKLKEEIEISKGFLEMLKKQKDKKDALVCKVKPRITAQSKGVISPYKGVFTNMEEAEASGKAISIVPGRDGKVYEIRCTDAGRFIVPATDIPELSEVSAGFFPALPPLPFSLFCQVIGFFRHFMGEKELEAMVQIYWDKELHEYRIAVPHQFVGKASVDAHIDIEDALDDERYTCFADIHSHNSMSARFSAIDDRDERMTRVYMVIGKLNSFFPDISARISCGGKRCQIDPATVIEGLFQDFPLEWTARVKTNFQEAAHCLKGALD